MADTYNGEPVTERTADVVITFANGVFNWYSVPGQVPVAPGTFDGGEAGPGSTQVYDGGNSLIPAAG